MAWSNQKCQSRTRQCITAPEHYQILWTSVKQGKHCHNWCSGRLLPSIHQAKKWENLSWGQFESKVCLSSWCHSRPPEIQNGGWWMTLHCSQSLKVQRWEDCRLHCGRVLPTEGGFLVYTASREHWTPKLTKMRLPSHISINLLVKGSNICISMAAIHLHNLLRVSGRGSDLGHRMRCSLDLYQIENI